jgi:hypothetical protein
MGFNGDLIGFNGDLMGFTTKKIDNYSIMSLLGCDFSIFCLALPTGALSPGLLLELTIAETRLKGEGLAKWQIAWYSRVMPYHAISYQYITFIIKFIAFIHTYMCMHNYAYIYDIHILMHMWRNIL